MAPDGRTYIEFARLLQFFQRSARLGGGDADEEKEEEEGKDDLYFLVEMDDMIDIGRLIEEIPMSLADRFTFCLAPVDTAKRELMAHLRYYALHFYREGCVRTYIRAYVRGTAVLPIHTHNNYHAHQTPSHLSIHI